MKCCKKGLLVLAVLAVGGFVLARSGWGEVLFHKASNAAKKKVAPELQLEKTKLDIAKLDQELEKNWTPIAVKEQEIKALKKDIDGLRVYVKNTEAELQTALADLKAGVERVSFKNSKKTQAEARRALLTEASLLAARKHELEFREKQLIDEEKALAAAMANQEAIITQKAELEAEVAAMEAELKVLRLEQRTSKLVLNDGSRLDNIRKRLDDVRKEIDVQKRTQELKNAYQTKPTGATADKARETKELTNDEVAKRIESVLGKGKDVGNGD